MNSSPATNFINKGFRVYYRLLMYLYIFISITCFVAALYLYSTSSYNSHTNGVNENQQNKTPPPKFGPMLIIGTLYFAFLAWVYRYVSVTKYAGIGFALFTLFIWITSSQILIK